MEKDFAYGCIIVKDGQVLLEKQKHKEERFWSFPKGHKEGNETDEESALREVKEEVGLDVEILDREPVLMEYDIFSEDGEHRRIHKTVKLYIAKPLGGTLAIQEAEVETACYLDPEEVADRLSFSAAKEAWAEAKERIKKLQK